MVNLVLLVFSFPPQDIQCRADRLQVKVRHVC